MMTHEDFNGAKIGEVSIALIDIPMYQRVLREAWAKEMADNWDHCLFDPPRLSQKADGRYDVIDGQHTIMAAEYRNHASIPARVFKDLPYEQAAALFVSVNTQRKRPTPFDTWRAAVEAGHQWALDLRDAATAHGLQVGMGQGSTHLRCVGQAKRILETEDGVRTLNAALDVLTEAYDPTLPENESRVERSLVMGMADFIRKARASGLYEKAHFVKKLRAAKFTRRDVRGIRVTPESFENYMAALIEQGMMPVPALNAGGAVMAPYGRAFAIAILGADGARRVYP